MVKAPILLSPAQSLSRLNNKFIWSLHAIQFRKHDSIQLCVYIYMYLSLSLSLSVSRSLFNEVFCSIRIITPPQIRPLGPVEQVDSISFEPGFSRNPESPTV